MDTKAKIEILETIKELKEENKAIVYTSHILEEVEQICTDIVFMKSGKIALDNTPIDSYNRGKNIYIRFSNSVHMNKYLEADNVGSDSVLSKNELVKQDVKKSDITKIIEKISALNISIDKLEYGKVRLKDLYIKTLY